MLGAVSVAGAWAFLSRKSLRPLMEAIAKAVSFDEACEGGAALRRPQSVTTEVSKLVHPGLVVQVEGSPEAEMLGGESFAASVGGLCLVLSRVHVEFTSVEEDRGVAKRMKALGDRATLNEAEYLWGVGKGAISVVEDGVARRFTFTADLVGTADPLQLIAAVVRVSEA